MENYKGYLLDQDTSDHTVTILTEDHKLVSVVATRGRAKAFVDGITWVEPKEWKEEPIAFSRCNVCKQLFSSTDTIFDICKSCESKIEIILPNN